MSGLNRATEQFLSRIVDAEDAKEKCLRFEKDALRKSNKEVILEEGKENGFFEYDRSRFRECRPSPVLLEYLV